MKRLSDSTRARPSAGCHWAVVLHSPPREVGLPRSQASESDAMSGHPGSFPARSGAACQLTTRSSLAARRLGGSFLNVIVATAWSLVEARMVPSPLSFLRRREAQDNRDQRRSTAVHARRPVAVTESVYACVL